MPSNEETARTERLSAAHYMVDGVRIVTLQGEIDHTTKNVLHNALLPPDDTAAPPRIVADMAGVTFLDSSGLNILISVHRHVSEAQGWLRIAAAQKAVQRVLSLVGLDTVIPCHLTVADALNG
ncbi:STAS domain-containing protein [Streptomyces litmocidini]|uniref:STAS domain-containing protein n=1 Tax=Streptomyces litmocidini TaxID=67318 RepID=UPI00340F6A27